MRSTLFYIPHADPWLHVPLLGAGWLLGLWAVASLVWMGWLLRSQGWRRETLAQLPVLLVIGAVILWVAPRLEAVNDAGVPIGVPIRGYGLMLLLGVIGGVALVAAEARRVGLDPDVIFSLAFWVFAAGIVGARIFYVIEYWEQFARPTARQTLVEIFRLTQGGLVVYGSLIGALIAAVWFLRRQQLPLLAVGDLLPAGMMLGVALGRIGCLLNGCCFGAVCGDCPLGVRFPPGSPPFLHQLENGQLVGMRLVRDAGDSSWTVAAVVPGSLADQQGLQPGDRIVGLELPQETELNRMRYGERVEDALVTYLLPDGRRLSWRFDQLPASSQPVYPTQLLSSVNAVLIGWFLWTYFPLRRRDGEVLALLLTFYPVTRFLLEMIRTDEPSVVPTSFKLTISQAVSVILLLVVVALWVYILRRPRGTYYPR